MRRSRVGRDLGCGGRVSVQRIELDKDAILPPPEAEGPVIDQRTELTECFLCVPKRGQQLRVVVKQLGGGLLEAGLLLQHSANLEHG